MGGNTPQTSTDKISMAFAVGPSARTMGATGMVPAPSVHAAARQHHYNRQVSMMAKELPNFEPLKKSKIHSTREAIDAQEVYGKDEPSINYTSFLEGEHTPGWFEKHQKKADVVPDMHEY